MTPFLFATVEPNTFGIAITSLIGSLGAMGAAVSITWYFLAFLRDYGDRSESWRRGVEARLDALTSNVNVFAKDADAIAGHIGRQDADVKRFNSCLNSWRKDVYAELAPLRDRITALEAHLAARTAALEQIEQFLERLRYHLAARTVVVDDPTAHAILAAIAGDERKSDWKTVVFPVDMRTKATF